MLPRLFRSRVSICNLLLLRLNLTYKFPPLPCWLATWWLLSLLHPILPILQPLDM